MSTANAQWWKKPTLMVPAIVAIMAAIIGAIWTYWLNPPSADFGVSISPLEGIVQQGGVVSPAITVTSQNGYKEAVSLSSTGQPAGVVVTFNSSNAVPKPSYTSNVNIAVDSRVPIGVYELSIRGLGADGKEHLVKYKFNVTAKEQLQANPYQANPYQASTQPQNEPVQPGIQITEPADKATIEQAMVSVSGTCPEDLLQDIWVIVWPEQALGKCWPQSEQPQIGQPAVKNNGRWSVVCGLGGPNQKYEIAVYTATPNASAFIGKKLREWSSNGEFKGLSVTELPPPTELKEFQRIHITKKVP